MAAAVHVDSADAEAGCAAAAAERRGGGPGDDDAQFMVDGAEDHELLWYATQEIPGLLRSVAGGRDAGRPRPGVAAPVSGGGYGSGGSRRAHICVGLERDAAPRHRRVIGATNAAFAEMGLAPLTLERYRELYCVPIPLFYERLMGRLPTDAEWQRMDEPSTATTPSTGRPAG